MKSTEAGRVYHWRCGYEEEELDMAVGRAELKVDVVPDPDSVAALARTMYQMSEVMAAVADSFRRASGSLSALAADLSAGQTGDPDCETGDVRTCTTACPVHGDIPPSAPAGDCPLYPDGRPHNPHDWSPRPGDLVRCPGVPG